MKKIPLNKKIIDRPTLILTTAGLIVASIIGIVPSFTIVLPLCVDFIAEEIVYIVQKLK